jgi:hypothetical protein
MGFAIIALDCGYHFQEVNKGVYHEKERLCLPLFFGSGRLPSLASRH